MTDNIINEFPYLSGCRDFEQISAHVSRDVMKEMEEAIRLYQETDKIVVEEDGGLSHVDGDSFLTSAIEWYCGMMDTDDFISEFGEDYEMIKLSFVDDIGYTEFEVSKEWYEKQSSKSDVAGVFHLACADDASHFNDLSGKYYEGETSLSRQIQSASVRAAESKPFSPANAKVAEPQI